MAEPFYIQTKLPNTEQKFKPEFKDADSIIKYMLSYNYDNYCVNHRNSRRHIPESKWTPVMDFPNFNVSLADLYEFYAQRFLQECNPEHGYKYSDDIKNLVYNSTVTIASLNAKDCLKKLQEKFPNSWIWSLMEECSSEWSERRQVINCEIIPILPNHESLEKSEYYLTFIYNGELVTEKFDKNKHKLSY